MGGIMDDHGRFIPYGIFKDLGLKTLVLYQFESDLHHRFWKPHEFWSAAPGRWKQFSTHPTWRSQAELTSQSVTSLRLLSTFVFFLVTGHNYQWIISDKLQLYDGHHDILGDLIELNYTSVASVEHTGLGWKNIQLEFPSCAWKSKDEMIQSSQLGGLYGSICCTTRHGN